MIRKNPAGKGPARKSKAGSSPATVRNKASQPKAYRKTSDDSKSKSYKSPRASSTSTNVDSKSGASTSRFASKGTFTARKTAGKVARKTSRKSAETIGAKREFGTTKKPYGAASSFDDRKKLRSLSESKAKAPKEKFETELKPERTNRSRTTSNFAGPKGKGKFTKKNELKGFKPKLTSDVDEDFRFKKPGSRGKQLILEEQQELGKTKLKGNTKEWLTENALKKGEEIRINRYISNAGVCSRREADELISAGLVSVNGQVVTELGLKVKAGDVVRFNGEKLNVEAKVYLVLNKPKDAITTSDDPEGRNTVMDLFEGKMRERVYPVGRLDRNTTGVLLLTNDGEMSQRLMHPKYEVKKVYKATLNKAIKPTDLWTLVNGVELEDGFIKPDALGQPDPKDKAVVGVEIHSGKNRIIHRIFEHLGYTVDKLDRVLYAGLDKGKLKRGEWRELTEKELKQLKRTVQMK